MSSPLVTVNGDTISMKDFYNYIQRKPTVIVDSQQGPVAARVSQGQSIGFQALREMVVDKIIQQIAKEQKVYPTDAEVADELKFMQKEADLGQSVNVVQNALSQGYTMESFKNQILIDLCRTKIMTKDVTVTPAEVQDFIKQHPDDPFFADPPKITALMILVKKDEVVANKGDLTAKDKVDAELKKGQPFLTVAQEYSIDPDARSFGWHYHVDNVNKMPTPVRTLLEKTDINQATPWVPANEGYVRFFVESKVKAHQKDTSNPTIQELVRRALAQQKGAQKVNLDALIAEKLKTLKDTDITIFPKAYQDPWKLFLDRIKASKPTTPAPGAPGAPAPAGAPASSAPAGNTPAAPPAGGAPAGATPPAGATAPAGAGAPPTKG